MAEKKTTRAGAGQYLVEHGKFVNGQGEPVEAGEVVTIAHADAAAGVAAQTLRELSPKQAKAHEQRKALEAKLASEDEEDEEEEDEPEESDEEESEESDDPKSKPKDEKPKADVGKAPAAKSVIPG